MHGANLQVDFGISEKHLTPYTLNWLKGMQKMAISSYERASREPTCFNSSTLRSSGSGNMTYSLRSMGRPSKAMSMVSL